MKVIFILGSGHCGSTLLDLMLDTHSQVVGVGEIATLNQRKNQRDRDPWETILSGLNTSALKVRRSKITFLAGSKQFYSIKNSAPIHTEAYCQKNRKLYTAALSELGGKLIVDSSKNVDRAELLAQCPDIEPFVIHLVRDGRGVSWSYLKKYPKRQIYALFKWILSNLKVEVMRLRWQHPFLRVRYEDLVGNPERELARIVQFVGIPYQENMLRFREYEHHHIGGNRMKHKKSGIREDTEWQQAMPLSYRLIFAIGSGWLNLWYKLR